jgi:outer membrane protein insertion porin family
MKSTFLIPLLLFFTLSLPAQEKALSAEGELQYEVQLRGNKQISTRKLRDRISRPEFELYSPYIAADLKEAIEDFYYSQGFAKVEVSAEDVTSANRSGIQVGIKEGRRYKVEKVIMEGNESYPEKELKETLRQVPRFFSHPPFDIVQVQRDRSTLQDFYIARGFLQARVEGEIELREDSGKAIIHHHIQEGPLYRIAQVRVSGNKVFSATEMADWEKVNGGEVYHPIEASQVRAAVLDFYRNHGYPTIKVELNVNIDEQSKEVFLHYPVVEGRQVHIQDITLSGNVKTKNRIIWDEVTLEKGQSYSRQDLFETRKNIFALGLFNSVSVEPASALTGQPTTEIRIEVEEGKFGSLRMGIGYGTLEGPRASIETSYSNLWGMAHEVGAFAEITGIGDNEEFYYRIMDFGDSGFDLRARIYHDVLEEPSFTVERFGSGLQLERQWNRDWSMILSYTIEELDLRDVDIEPTVEDFRQSEGILAKAGFQIGYDGRDRLIDPHTGMHSWFSLEWSDQGIGSDFDFVKAQARTSWYLPVSRFTTLALSLRGGILEPYGRSDISPLGERFLIGGDDTLRGFERNKVGPRTPGGDYPGGNAMFIFNAEYRFPIYKDLKGAVFYDTGNVWEDASDIDFGDLRESAGFGFRYISSIAAIRLDYGHVLDPRENEEDYRIHLSIGHAF